jgi:UDP-N-acetylmuramoyl-tripeptide--D-alanyl-D-alanine ligase
MTIAQLYDIYKRYPSVQTDSRRIKQGDLFFALKGPSFNGNSFATKALADGAAYAIIDEAAFKVDDRYVMVADVLSTLQQLALHHRRQFNNTPFIAITGSNGKTTTKELVHAVLSSQYKTYTTKGNLNNHIGIPLTILSVGLDAEFAVIEMGANHQKEIAGYCTYTLPTYGIITNCGKAHLEGFGGVEGVRKGKGELYDHLRSNGGTAFVMWDFDYLRTMSEGIKNRITYGTVEANYVGEVIKSEPFLEINISKGANTGYIQSQLVGDYNLPNLLVAVAVGKHFGVGDTQVRQAIENYSPSNSRSQLMQVGTNVIILDAYNANPSSMKLAIKNFAKQAYEQKLLLLGSMAELGAESEQEHRDILQLINQYQWKEVVLVGEEFRKVNASFKQFPNSADAADWFKQQNFEKVAALVKGSRSTQMEKVIGL